MTLTNDFIKKADQETKGAMMNAIETLGFVYDRVAKNSPISSLVSDAIIELNKEVEKFDV